jgi:hypothetical protein
MKYEYMKPVTDVVKIVAGRDFLTVSNWTEKGENGETDEIIVNPDTPPAPTAKGNIWTAWDDDEDN